MLIAEELAHGGSPAQLCRCGIYALERPDELPQADVVGRVKLWGKVICASKGVRAQYAYPSKLYVPTGLVGDKALYVYGVPVVVPDEEEDLSEVDRTSIANVLGPEPEPDWHYYHH